jgi:isopenicillin-N N-acyltransferase like protein
MSEIRRFKSSVLDSHDRGIEFGAAHPDQIRATIAAYDEVFAIRGAECGVPRRRADEIAQEIGRSSLERVQAFAPELALEIAGIASGAGLPSGAVATINARTEVLAALQQAGVEAAPERPVRRGECSAVVALGADGAEPVAMQNWDWFLSLADGWFEWEIPHPDGGVTTTVTEYGIVGKIGFGRHGVGVLFNILGHERDGQAPAGVPVHVISRHVMDTATSVDEAIALARTASASASTVLTLATGNATGKTAACAEIWPGGVDVIEPHNGLLYHTNHFLADAPRAGDLHPETMPDTLERLDALHRQLDARGGDADDQQVRNALCDHGGGPNSLCCHPDPADPEGARYATLLTATLNFTECTLDVSPGTPCEHQRVSEAVAATA